MNWLMKIFFRGLLIFFGIVLCGEIFLRVFSPQPSFQNHTTVAFGLPTAFQKNLNVDASFDKFPFKIITDSNQLRSFQKVDYKKSPGTFRILCIGGSIFAASGVNNDETFAYYLNEALKDRIPDQKFEVINAAKNLWELPEFYTYLKNEGYKYNPDLVIIYEHRGEFSAMDLKKYEAEELKIETISENSTRFSIKGFHFNFYLNQAAVTTLGLIHNLPFYDNLFGFSHSLKWFEKFCRDRLYKTEEDVSINSKRTNIPSALSGLNLSEKSKINWASPNGEIKDSLLRNIKWDVYSLALEQFMDLAEELNSKTLFLRVAAREEILKLNENSASANLTSLKERESSAWLNFFEPMIQFQSSQAIPLNFPNHIHWTPAGHRLGAFLTFNALIEGKLIPFKNNLDGIKIDLANSKWIDQIASSNSRVKPFIDSMGYTLFLKGVFQNNNNQRTEAIKTFQTYLQKFPNNSEARMQLAIILLEEGNASTALDYLTPISDLEENPDSSYFYLLGKTYFKLKKWNQALINFEKYRKQYPKDPKIHHFLGLIHFQKKNYSEAQNNYLKSIELKPGYTPYINRLGSFYYDLGQLETAQVQFQNSLKLNSNQAKIWLLSGLTSLRLNNLQKALQSMENVLRLEPTNSMAVDIVKKLKTALKVNASNGK
jgi:tetratricopeptide (TPR) repeat protein